MIRQGRSVHVKRVKVWFPKLLATCNVNAAEKGVKKSASHIQDKDTIRRISKGVSNMQCKDSKSRLLQYASKIQCKISRGRITQVKKNN